MTVGADCAVLHLAPTYCSYINTSSRHKANTEKIRKQSTRLQKILDHHTLLFQGGWDWFTWSDKVVNYVMTYIEENRFNKSSLLVRLSHTNAPSEKFYTTLLFDKLERLKVRKYYPLRFVSWTPHHPINVKRLPYPLNELDYEYVVNSPTFFCRKIEEVESAKLLDMIDAQRDSAFNIEQFTEFT